MMFQIIIVSVGGIVFNVTMIGWDHWMWCILLGLGVLLWGQVFISISKCMIYFHK